MRRKVIAVYAIKNTKTGAIYIGGSTNVVARFSTHRVKLRSGKHENSRLQKSWNNDGERSFCFGIVEVIKDHSALCEREQYWIDKFVSMGVEIYNIALIAGTTTGVHFSDERRARISCSLMGRKASVEERLRMSESRKGRRHTEEAKRKIAIARVGVRHSEETRIKMSQAQRRRYAINEALI